jgi:hypothetical protein
MYEQLIIMLQNLAMELDELSLDQHHYLKARRIFQDVSGEEHIRSCDE